jgi:hypothetical protein
MISPPAEPPILILVELFSIHPSPILVELVSQFSPLRHDTYDTHDQSFQHDIHDISRTACHSLHCTFRTSSHFIQIRSFTSCRHIQISGPHRIFIRFIPFHSARLFRIQFCFIHSKSFVIVYISVVGSHIIPPPVDQFITCPLISLVVDTHSMHHIAPFS